MGCGRKGDVCFIELWRFLGQDWELAYDILDVGYTYGRTRDDVSGRAFLLEKLSFKDLALQNVIDRQAEVSTNLNKFISFDVTICIYIFFLLNYIVIWCIESRF